MAQDGDIELVITLNDGQVVKGLVKAEQQAKRSGDAVEGYMRRGFNAGFSILNRQVLALGASLVAAFGARKALASAIGQESAINRINQAMISAGTFTNAASLSFQKMADEIQRTTTVSDDAALSAAALARNFSKTNEQAEKLTLAALDLSAATGDSLESAVEKLGGTLSGSAGKLGKLVPDVNNLTEAQLKAGGAVDIIAGRFKGFAEGEVNTFAGAMAQLGNKFDEVLEKIGGLIVKSPAAVAAIKFVGDQFVRLGKAIENIDPAKVKETLLQVVDLGKVFVAFVVQPVEFFIRAFRLAITAVALVVQAVFVGVIEAFSNMALSAVKIAGMFTDKFDGAAESIIALRDSSRDAFKDIANGLGEQAGSMFNNAGATAGNAFLDGMRGAIEKAPPIPPPVVVPPRMPTTEFQKDVELTVNFGNMLAQSLSATTLSIANTLGKGRAGWAAFGKSILGIMGDFAISLGNMIIAAALGVEALKASLISFGGVGLAIAAGVGLILVGGLLKRFSGGPAGMPASGGGGVASQGNASAGGGSAVTDGVADIPEQGPRVQVVVQGNILDRRQTGLELAEVISEAFGGQAVVFG